MIWRSMKPAFWFFFWLFKMPEAVFTFNDVWIAGASNCQDWYPLLPELVIGALFALELLVM